LIPALTYLDFFHDYFDSQYVQVGLAAGISLMFFCYIATRFSEGIRKSLFLVSISAVSTSLWIFVLSSLAFCMMFVGQYSQTPIPTILLVAKFALAFSASLGASSMLIFRKHALSRAYRTIMEQSLGEETGNPPSYAEEMKLRISKTIRNLTYRVNQNQPGMIIRVYGIVLSNRSTLPPSLAFDWHDLKLIAIKKEVAEMLDDDELETVIGHELGHIRYKDALQKSIATAYRIAFPFDIIARLSEAAIFRQREFLADDFSAKITRKPVSLASALLKIYEKFEMSLQNNTSHISYLMSGSAYRKNSRRLDLFSKEPSIEARIERLLHADNF
jgi:Zn-dependent protease with chaperone function